MTDAAVAFARALRAAGLDVPVGRVVHYTAALGALGLSRREWVYWAGRATLLRGPEDVAAYDAVFARFWLGRETVTGAGRWQPVHALAPRADEEGRQPDDEPGGERAVTAGPRYSRREVLRHKDFGAYSAAEHEEARRLMAGLRLGGGPRRSRRLTAGGRRGRRPDLRSTVRAGIRTGGELLERHWRSPSLRPRRTVVLCDVSGSMDTYARPLLRFMHAAVKSGARTEAFTVGTRLTRLTRELARTDPDAALRGAGVAVADWAGGTRLGDGLREFNDRWGVRGLARGAVVVIVSDGWDRGDPAVLAAEMARLRRVAHRVIWVNPLKVSPGYQPLTRGMAAALPFVDDFVEGHSLAALEALAAVVAGAAGDGDRERRGAM